MSYFFNGLTLGILIGFFLGTIFWIWIVFSSIKEGNMDMKKDGKWLGVNKNKNETEF